MTADSLFDDRRDDSRRATRADHWIGPVPRTRSATGPRSRAPAARKAM